MTRATPIRYLPRRGSAGAALRWQPSLLGMLIGSLATGALASPELNTAPTVAQMTFDTSMLSGHSKSTVDYSRFDKGNIVLPGTYRADVMVNENRLARRDVKFVAIEGQDSAAVCFSREMLVDLGVDLGKVARGNPGAAQPDGREVPEGPLCGDLGTWIPGATSSFDMAEQTLSVSVPQIFMNLSARGYVDPSQWDNGINAGLLGYNFTSSTATSGTGGKQAYLGLVGGITWVTGACAIRAPKAGVRYRGAAPTRTRPPTCSAASPLGSRN